MMYPGVNTTRILSRCSYQFCIGEGIGDLQSWKPTIAVDNNVRFKHMGTPSLRCTKSLHFAQQQNNHRNKIH